MGFRIKKGGGSGSGVAIAEDMYFSTTGDRDTFATANPARLTDKVVCAINGDPNNVEYY